MDTTGAAPRKPLVPPRMAEHSTSRIAHNRVCDAAQPALLSARCCCLGSPRSSQARPQGGLPPQPSSSEPARRGRRCLKHNPSSSSPAHVCHRRSQVSLGGPRAGTSNSKGPAHPRSRSHVGRTLPTAMQPAPVTSARARSVPLVPGPVAAPRAPRHRPRPPAQPCLRALCSMYFNKMFALGKMVSLCLLSVIPVIRRQERNPGARPRGIRQGSPSQGPPTPGFPRASSCCRAPPRKTHPRPRGHLCTGPRGQVRAQLPGAAHGLRGSAPPTAESSSNLPAPRTPFMWAPSNLRTLPPAAFVLRTVSSVAF